MDTDYLLRPEPAAVVGAGQLIANPGRRVEQSELSGAEPPIRDRNQGSEVTPVGPTFVADADTVADVVVTGANEQPVADWPETQAETGVR